jgi:hypothetical protein
VIRRALRRFAAVGEADQADDRVARLDPLPDLLVDFQEGQVEDGLVIDLVAAFAQRLDGRPPIALQAAGWWR